MLCDDGGSPVYFETKSNSANAFTLCVLNPPLKWRKYALWAKEFHVCPDTPITIEVMQIHLLEAYVTVLSLVRNGNSELYTFECPTKECDTLDSTFFVLL